MKEEDGKKTAQIHKDFLFYFKTDPSFNAYGFEMMVTLAQNEISLSEREAHHAIWRQTVKWKGGRGKHIYMEMDLTQENRNCDENSLIKAVGANKTEKTMKMAAGGLRKQGRKLGPSERLGWVTFPFGEGKT